MKTVRLRVSKSGIRAIIGVFLVAASADAQQAVQWKVSDGGNGHWYSRVSGGTGISHWPFGAAQSTAVSVGAQLASFESLEEGLAVYGLLGVALLPPREAGWIGLFQDRSDPAYSEPGGGWKWVSGAALSYSYWAVARPDNAGCGDPLSAQDWGKWVGGQALGDVYARWDDEGDPSPRCPFGTAHAIFEWSADCNSDGIVDYGQCLDGSLPDYDGNNIPDCCESGNSCAPNIIVNGGFEIGAPQTDCSWVIHPAGGPFIPGWTVIAASIDRVRLSASCPPGVESWMSFQGEFTIDLDGGTHGGAVSQAVATEPGSTYRLTFQLTGNCAPGVKPMRVEIGSTQYPFEHACSGTNPQPWSEKSIEFTAAASMTNIVFRSLSTSGRNGAVIDSVRMIRVDPQQPTCRDADFFADRNINGVDLGVLLSQWGAPTQYTVADLDRDGVVDGIDLGLFLSFWGPCPY